MRLRSPCLKMEVVLYLKYYMYFEKPKELITILFTSLYGNGKEFLKSTPTKFLNPCILCQVSDFETWMPSSLKFLFYCPCVFILQ